MSDNYQSDIKIRVRFTVGGETVNIPSHDFCLRFRTQPGGTFYDCSKKDGVYKNCAPDQTNTQYLICSIDAAGFSPGSLYVELFDFVPDDSFADGNMLKVVPCPMGTDIVVGAGDGAEIDADVYVEIASQLGEFASDLADLDERVDMIESSPDIPVALDRVWAYANAYIRHTDDENDGTIFSSSSNFANTGFVEIPEGYDKITVKVRASSTMYAIAFYTSNVPQDTHTSILAEDSVVGTDYDSTVEYEADIPEGARYFVVSNHDGDGTHLNFSCVLWKDNATGLVDLQRQITAIENSDKWLKGPAINPISANLGDLDSPWLAKDDQGNPITEFCTATGFYSNDNCRRTDYIPLAGQTHITYKLNLSGVVVAFFDTSKQRIISLNVSASGPAEGEIDLTMNQYKNAAYVIFSSYDGTHEFTSFGGKVFFKSTLEARVSALEGGRQSSSGMKRVLIFGDSITDTANITVVNGKTTKYAVKSPNNSEYHQEGGSYVSKGFKMWPTLLEESLDVEVRNYARSGGHWLDRDTSDPNYDFRQNVSEQIALAIADADSPNEGVWPDDDVYTPDIIIFALGTNDWGPLYVTGHELNLDDPYEAFNASRETLQANRTTHFCQSMRLALMEVKEQWPYAKIYVSLPIQRGDYPYAFINAANGLYMHDAMKTIANMMSAEVIDCTFESGITGKGFTQYYGKMNSTGSREGLHPGENGQEMIAARIIKEIK